MREVILGHRGMVGSAIHRILPGAELPPDWDLRQRDAVMIMSETSWEDVDVLYLCAARVGGIQRNIEEPGAMIYDNLMIHANVIEAARLAGVKLIVFLGSSCIYPSYVENDLAMNGQYMGPWSEDYLMCGPLEPSNEPYAIAKIAGIKMLEAYHRQYGMEYLAVMPCNLYGPGDNFDPQTSHFIPGMIRKFHEAKDICSDTLKLWGTGNPRREIMHVDDCARIIVELVRQEARGLINIGPGVDHDLKFYAEMVRSVAGWGGKILWDESKPDGVARKLLDVSRMKGFGVEPQIHSLAGIRSTYEWFLKNEVKA